jgi:splicing factor 3B subunit 5
MNSQDRLAVNSQLESLQAKHVGAGHSDISRHEWATNIHRDSLASYIGHHNMLAYFALAENEAPERMRHTFMQRMVQPCGKPPKQPRNPSHPPQPQ